MFSSALAGAPAIREPRHAPVAQMASGAGRDVAALMHAVPGLLAKDGFEGVHVAALPDGRAVAECVDALVTECAANGGGISRQCPAPAPPGPGRCRVPP